MQKPVADQDIIVQRPSEECILADVGIVEVSWHVTLLQCHMGQYFQPPRITLALIYKHHLKLEFNVFTYFWIIYDFPQKNV